MIEHTRVERGLALQRDPELVALHRADLLLILDVEDDLGRIEFEEAALAVALDRPFVGEEGRGIAVDQAARADGHRVEVALDRVLQAPKHLLDRERPLADATEEVVLTASENAELLVGDNMSRHDKSPLQKPLVSIARNSPVYRKPNLFKAAT